jgi:glycosyltransferase involved in cell wall biosynthesis
MPIVHLKNPQIKFVIGGDGSLKDEVTRKLHESGFNDKVELLGWIPQEDLPQTLSKMKLLVMLPMEL